MMLRTVHHPRRGLRSGSRSVVVDGADREVDRLALRREQDAAGAGDQDGAV
jgi:hypothetical protein